MEGLNLPFHSKPMVPLAGLCSTWEPTCITTYWNEIPLIKWTDLFSELCNCCHELEDSTNPFSLPTVTRSAFTMWDLQASFRGGTCQGLGHSAPHKYHSGVLIILNSSYLRNSQQRRDIPPPPDICLPESRKCISYEGCTACIWRQRETLLTRNRQFKQRSLYTQTLLSLSFTTVGTDCV